MLLLITVVACEKQEVDKEYETTTLYSSGEDLILMHIYPFNNKIEIISNFEVSELAVLNLTTGKVDYVGIDFFELEFYLTPADYQIVCWPNSEFFEYYFTIE